MRIFIDADGCPVVPLAIRLAKEHSLPVTVVKNYAHEVEDAYAEIVTVDISPDAADYYIANALKKGDILITQDYGLAAMALSRGARCLSQNGLILSDHNILSLLDRRHVNRKLRKTQGIYTKLKKRTPADDEAFRRTFLQLITSSLQP